MCRIIRISYSITKRPLDDLIVLTAGSWDKRYVCGRYTVCSIEIICGTIIYLTIAVGGCMYRIHSGNHKPLRRGNEGSDIKNFSYSSVFIYLRLKFARRFLS